jgi:urease accessory protein
MNGTVTALLNGLQSGALNPLQLPAHLIALVGLALMIGQQTQRRATLAAFALGLATGLVALAAAVGETPAETIILSGAAVAALAAASGWPVPGILGAPLALIIGAAFGLDSPPRAASIQAAHAALAGTALAAVAMVGVVAAITARLRQGWLRIGVRVLGSWVAASVILVLTLRLVR